MSQLEDILAEVLGGGQPVVRSSRPQRSQRSRRTGQRGFYNPQASQNPALDSLAAEEQYRVRLASHASQTGAGDEIIDAILEADTNVLPAMEEALLEGNPEAVGVIAHFSKNDDDWFSRNVENKVSGGVGVLFRELDRLGNAVRGGLTEAAMAQDDPFAPIWNQDLGDQATSFARGAGRGIQYDQYYSGRDILRSNPATAGIEDNPVGGPIAGFATEVLTDPLTFTRFGVRNPNVQAGATRAGRQLVDQVDEQFQREAGRLTDINELGPRIEERMAEQFGTVRRDAQGRARSLTPEERMLQNRPPIIDPRTGERIRRGTPRPTEPPARFPQRRQLFEEMTEDEMYRQAARGANWAKVTDEMRRNAVVRDGYFTMEFAGKQVFGDNKISRTLYGSWAGLKDATAGTRLGGALNRAFNFKAVYPGDMAEYLSTARANNAGIAQQHFHDLTQLAKVLDEDQVWMVAEVLDSIKFAMGKEGQTNLDELFDTLDNIPLDSPVNVVNGANSTYQLGNLGQVARVMYSMLEDTHNRLVALGLRAPDETYDFFPIVNKRTKGKRQAIPEQLKNLPLAKLRRRTDLELVNPFEAMAEGIAQRLHRISYADMTWQTLTEYGIRTKDPLKKTRKVKLHDGTPVKATSKAAQNVEDVVSGDLDLGTFLLSQGQFPKLQVGKAGKIVDEHGFTYRDARTLNNPELKKYLNEHLDPGDHIFLPEQIADTLEYMARIVTDDDFAAEFVGQFDHLMAGWKKLITAANPAFHMRNTFSDFVMARVAGTTPKWMENSLRVLVNRYNVSERQLINRTVLTDSLPEFGARVANRYKNNRAFLKIGRGERIRQDDLWRAFSMESGSKSGYIQSELRQYEQGLSIGSPLGRLDNAIVRFSENREDLFRLATFLDFVDKNAKKRGVKLMSGKDFTPEGVKLFREAGAHVRKHHLDYAAKTPIERKYMSRLFPFYTFFRKNLALQAHLLLTRPGVIGRYPKYANLFEGLLGAEEDGTPLTPQWVQQSMPWQVHTNDQIRNGPIGQLLNLFGMNNGNDVVMPMENILPVGTLNQVLGPLTEGGGQPGVGDNIQALFNEVVNMQSPFLKIPTEVATGRSLLTGAEISDWTEYAAQNLGQWGRNIYSTVDSGDSTVSQGWRSWANTFTGIPLREITEQNQQSELERRSDALEGQRSSLRGQVNESLLGMGISPDQLLTSLPGIDTDQLIAQLLQIASQQGRPVRQNPNYDPLAALLGR